MAFEIIMPKMGESITEGTVIEWKKKIGENVKKDETLLEISTDKVDSEVPSPSGGVLIEILANSNDVVEVGSVIGYIGEKNEKVESSKTSNSDKKSNQNKIEPKAAKDENEIHLKEKPILKSQKFYSPLVRSIAKREKIPLNELDSINGSGKGGRVNKSDILNYLKSRGNSSGSMLKPPTPTPIPNDEIVQMDAVRKSISAHMIHSQQVSAHVYSTVEIDMTNLLDVIDKYRELYQNKYKSNLLLHL